MDAGKLEAEEAGLGGNHQLLNSALSDTDRELTSPTSADGLEPRSTAIAPMQNGEEEGGRKWSDAEGEKTSPDWTPSEPSSEGEEGGEEGTAESGYTLLPQDNEETMLNGVRESYGEEEELEVKETVSPRMTRWLQKQVDDMSSSSGSSKAESTGWARFDDPASSQDSQDWPTSSSTSQDRTVAMQSMATESVEPTSTMEEGMYYKQWDPTPHSGHPEMRTP